MTMEIMGEIGLGEIGLAVITWLVPPTPRPKHFLLGTHRISQVLSILISPLN